MELNKFHSEIRYKTGAKICANVASNWYYPSSNNHHSTEEVQVRQGISPGQKHSECSFLTHPFIARDIITERVCYFQRGSVKKVVFEGMDFGAPHDGRIDVDILWGVNGM